MNKLRIVFFFALLAIVIMIARYNSKSNPRAETKSSPAPVVAASVSPPPQATASPAVAMQTPMPQPSAAPDLKKVAERVRPGVVLISAFDKTGKLLRSGTGCFISDDGRFITSSSIAQGASYAVAKTSDGGIYNVAGILADANNLDIAVLKAEAKKGVAFLAPNKSATMDVGAHVAVVGSALTRRKPAHFEGTIAARRSDQTGDWLELSTAIPNECIGAPVVNEKGEFIGVVTSQRGQEEGKNVVRVASTVESVVARIDPKTTAGWLAAKNAEPSPPAAGPNKPKVIIPLVRAEQPGSSRLVYSPKPTFPNVARRSNSPLQGNGQFRIVFAANGQVKNVEIVESTRNSALDSAATDTLRKWKAAPGREWSATVPITFQP